MLILATCTYTHERVWKRMYKYTHACLCTCVRALAHACLRMCAQACVCACMQVCVGACVCACVHVYKCARERACMCVYVYMCVSMRVCVCVCERERDRDRESTRTLHTCTGMLRCFAMQMLLTRTCFSPFIACVHSLVAASSLRTSLPVSSFWVGAKGVLCFCGNVLTYNKKCNTLQ